MRTERRLVDAALRMSLTLIAAVVALAFFVPFAWMMSSSLRSQNDIFLSLSRISVHILWPQDWSVASYVRLVDGYLARSILNSLIVTVGTVVPGVLLSAGAAFALCTMRVPFRNALFWMVVISFMIPFEVVAIPLSGQFRDWGLQNSYLGIVLPALANGMAVFLLRQFFMGIPPELREAALVDAAGWWTIFWRIYLPLSKPALIGAGLMFFLGQWHAYLWPLLVTTRPEMNVAPVAIAQFSGEYGTQYGPMFAAATVVSLVPAVVLLLLQPYFARSLATEGLK